MKCDKRTRWGWPAWRLGVILLAAHGGAASATNVSWNGGTGFWDDPSRWSLSLVPNNGANTYEVSIGGATVDVSLNLSATINTLSNSGILRLLSGSSLTLLQPGGLQNSNQLIVNHTGTSSLAGAVNNSGFAWLQAGTLELASSNFQNSGTIWLGNGSAAGGTNIFRVQSDLSLQGNGEIYFFSSAATQANQPKIDISAGRRLINTANHRIHGGSGVIQGAGELVNQGLIDADTPLRTLTLNVANFRNEGNLWARSGNLNVAVDDWHNAGIVRVSNGGTSAFSGSLLTNEAGGVIESVGGASLSIAQSLYNSGLIGTGGAGRINFTGANALIVNWPTGIIQANSGTARFEGSNSYVQNFGTLRADQGQFEFANGADVFGGNLSLANNSSAAVFTGITNLTQVRTTMDAGSLLEVRDLGAGAATLNFDGVLQNAGGVLATRSDAGNTATFNLAGRYVGTGGTLRSDGGDLNVGNALFEQTGLLSLDIRHGGDIRFTNVDSTASQMAVSWTGSSGLLSFDNYRRSTPTSLNLANWTATGGTLSVLNGTSIGGIGRTSLPGGSTLSIGGAGAKFSMSSLTSAPSGSLIDIFTGGRLVASNLSLDGEIRLRGGTFEGNLHLNSPAVFTVNTGTNLITGGLSWAGNREVQVVGSNTTLGFGGPMTVPAGSRLAMLGNSNRVNGAGLITNQGLIEGGAPSNSNSTFLDSNVVNSGGGVIRAFQNGAATTTYLQVTGDVTNSATMEAQGANLYFTGADVQNTGLIRALDHPAGSKLIFLGGANVSGSGSSTLAGAGSALEISGAANVAFGSLALSNGADGFVSGSGSSLSIGNSVLLGIGSLLEVHSSSQLSATGAGSLDVAGGILNVRNSATVNAPITLRLGGQLTADSSVANLNGPVTVQNNGAGGVGRISLLANGAQLAGTGTITNSGIIEGGAPSNGNSTYIDNALVNNSNGIVQAFRNGTPTNTYLQMRGPVTNAGVMRADGANLYFTGSTVQNTGTIQALDNAVGSKLIFLAGAQVTGTGTGSLAGANSALEVSGAANVSFGSLQMTGGSGGFVTNNGSEVRFGNPFQLGAGSTFSVTSSGRLSATGAGSLDLNGANLVVQSAGTVNAPITVRPSGRITADSGNAILNGNVTVQNNGAGGLGRISLLANSAQLSGTGVITNNGLIEGGAPNTNNSVYLDNNTVNNALGVIRAFQNGAATNTYLQLRESITNAGLIEGDAGNLYFTTANIQNSGVIRGVNGSRVYFLDSTKVTDAGGSFSLASAATGEINGNGVDVAFATTVGSGSTLSLWNSARLGGPSLQLNGQLEMRGSARLIAPTTVSPTGQVVANSSVGFIDANVNVQQNGSGGLGRISLVANNAQIAGSGTITNHGLIEGGATNNSNTVYLDNTTVNAADGTIRAFQNGAATNTFFRLRGNVTNQGLIESQGGNIVFAGNAGPQQVLNSGIVRATGGSTVYFVDGAKMFDAGGTLRLSSGGSGIMDGGGVEANATTVVDAGSALTVTNSSRLGGPSAQISGDMFLRNSAVVTAPVSVMPGGLMTLDSGAVSVNTDLSTQNNGAGGTGRISLVGNSARLGGTGSITNHGILEGGAPNTNNATFVDSELVNESDGVVRAFSNNGALNTRLQLASNNIINRGQMTADQATLHLLGNIVDTTNGSWSAINGGRLLVDGTFVSGASGSNTTVDGATSSLELVNNALVGFDTLSLTNGGDLTVNGTFTGLAVLSPFSLGSGSVATLVNGGRLTTAGVTLSGGSIAGQGGTVASNVHVGAGGTINATSGSTVIEGNVTTASGALVSVTNSGTSLVVKGTLNNVNGSTVRLNTNTTALSGAGLFTNQGLLEGGGFNNNNTNTMSKNLSNSGQVIATSASGATGTTFQINSPTVTNSGSMTAIGANLTFTGSNISHSGTMRAENGRALTFQNSSVVNNLGGGVQVDGDGSLLQVLASSNAGINSLSLTNGGDVLVQGATLQTTNPFTVGPSSVLSVNGSGTLSGGAVQVNANMNAGQATITAPVTIGPTGTLAISSSSPGTFNAPVQVQGNVTDKGRITLPGNSFRMNGTGLITNSGIIEGAAPSTNNSTFVDNPITNTSAGTIRAVKQAAGTNTYLQFSNAITNQGTMEANGANLYFTTGSNVQNSGTVRALAHADGSKLIFLGGGRLDAVGGAGTGQVDGSTSTLEISGGSSVGFGTLSLTNGASGFVTGATSSLSANTTIGAGSSFAVQSGAQLGGVATQVSGGLTVTSSTVTAPVTVTSVGTITANSTASTFNNTVTLQSVGPLRGTLSVTGDNARVNGSGQIVNSGLVRAGAPNGTAFLDNNLLNNAAGMVQAYKAGASNTSTFRLNGSSITNNGLFVADQARLSIGTSGMLNNGTVRTQNSGGFIADGPVSTGASAAFEFAAGSTPVSFNSTLNNNGVLDIANNTVQFANNLSFGVDARLRATAGAVMQVSGDWLNGSTRDDDFDTDILQLSMTRSASSLEVSGLNTGAVLGGFIGNFSLDLLLVPASVTSLQLVDLFDNQANGANNDVLYVSTLTLQGASTQFLLSGHTVYYGTFNGLPGQIVPAGGSFIQVVGAAPHAPEPAGITLLLAGWVLMNGRRVRVRQGSRGRRFTRAARHLLSEGDLP